MNFLGSGIKFPFSINSHTGGVEKTISTGFSDIRKIDEGMVQLVNTRKNERFMNRGFGCDLNKLLSKRNTNIFFSLFNYVLTDAIDEYEKRVELKNILFEVDDNSIDNNKIKVKLSYESIKTQKEGNFVFPYYDSLPIE